MTNKVKTIVPVFCPHCQGEILVEYSIVPPELTSVFKPTDVALAKSDAIERIKTLSIDESKKQETVDWINDEETIFSVGEVDHIIQSLLTPDDNS